jgi:hypothetical protein
VGLSVLVPFGPAVLRRRPAELQRGHDEVGSYWVYVIKGGEVVLREIGLLAAAIERSSKSVRRLERTDVIPPCRFFLIAGDPRANRRLYTEWWIDEVRRIASDEGVLGRKVANWAGHPFPERLAQLREQVCLEDELRFSAQPHLATAADLGLVDDAPVTSSIVPWQQLRGGGGRADSPSGRKPTAKRTSSRCVVRGYGGQ